MQSPSIAKKDHIGMMLIKKLCIKRRKALLRAPESDSGATPVKLISAQNFARKVWAPLSLRNCPR